MPDPFEQPTAVSGGKFPAMKQLGTGCKERTVTYGAGTPQEKTLKTKGRLVLIQPTHLDKNVPGVGKDAKPRDRITANVTVFDGPPIEAVIDKDGEITHEFEEPLTPPFTLEGMYISQAVMVGQLRNALENKGRVLGRMAALPPQTAGNSRAWCLASWNQKEAAFVTQWLTENAAASIGNAESTSDDDDDDDDPFGDD